jgi:5-methyltetrahydrofolate--homocysteine methyltransferase
MSRRGFTIPLLIGGATTSRQHTSVKIAPEFGEPVVHVLDASRAVDVVSNLLSPTQKPAFTAANRAEQDRLRQQHASLKRRPLRPWAAASANRPPLAWSTDTVATPSFTGVRMLDEVRLDDLVPYIDWTFFFAAWELKGRFPAILDHPTQGAAARELYNEARVLLDRIVADRLLTPRGVYGFWPANTVGDDIVVYDPGLGTGDSGLVARGPEREMLRFNMLRQQEEVSAGTPHLSLADYIAPLETGIGDFLGAFAVTTGHGVDELVASFERDHDDYHAIMVKALADRLAEAFAEYLHARARRDWGYGAGERLTSEDLAAERYRGIRPAFGYPACPDHSEKGKLFNLLSADRAGLTLTETYAMSPAASVSGLYFSHPDARYFTVGPVGRDQIEDYATRKGMSVADIERWLTPNLSYEPVSA